VLVALAAATAAAAVEEVVFRGLVQVTLQRVAGRAGLVAASALFAATYLDASRAALVLAFALAGLVFAYAVARTGTLAGAVGGHVLLAAGAGGLWPAVLGRSHLAWLHGAGTTIGLILALTLVAAIVLRRPPAAVPMAGAAEGLRVQITDTTPATSATAPIE
jgi:membrane protease YdiL (CAAX protease family)